MVKNLPANAGDVRDAGLVPGLGESSEEEIANYSRILSWEIPWTEEPGSHSHGITKSQTLINDTHTQVK